MKKLMLAVVLVGMAQSAMGQASFYKGNEMLEFCRARLKSNLAAQDKIDGNLCAGYAAGIVDVHKAFVDWGDIQPQWCIPEGAGLTQLARVVVNLMEEYPEGLHTGAGSLAANAFGLAFPCD